MQRYGHVNVLFIKMVSLRSLSTERTMQNSAAVNVKNML